MTYPRSAHFFDGARQATLPLGHVSVSRNKNQIHHVSEISPKARSSLWKVCLLWSQGPHAFSAFGGLDYTTLCVCRGVALWPSVPVLLATVWQPSCWHRARTPASLCLVDHCLEGATDQVVRGFLSRKKGKLPELCPEACAHQNTCREHSKSEPMYTCILLQRKVEYCKIRGGSRLIVIWPSKN